MAHSPVMDRRRRTRDTLVLVTLVGVALAIGCSGDEGDGQVSGPPASVAVPDPKPAPSPPQEPAVETRSPEELIEAGRSAYNANCIACHAMDPTVDGALGPAVAGASLELLESRVVRGEYPEGYVPKRTTRVMIPLPHLAPRIPELVAYLDSLE